MPRLSHRPRLLALLGVFAGLALASSCTDSPTAPVVDPGRPAVRMGQLAVYAQSNALAQSGTLVVQVSGPGIVKSDGTTPDTLAFNIAMANGVASGSITVPAGPQRVITVRAFDGLTETHRGSVVTDIVVGANPTITVTLVPLVGDVTISVSIGTTIVIVRPGVATLGVGDTLRMSAEVRDQDGGLVEARVRWATLNPGRASVDTLGLVTMRDTGEVQVVATYGTVGGSARLSGTPKTSAVAYQLTWNGSVNRNWTEPNNWTPFGVGAARAPTAADSVVIPAGVANQPWIDGCGDVSVRDLVVQAGASLGTNCGYGVNVYRGVTSRGAVTAPIYARPGATLAGSFTNLYVRGDTVTLADSVRADNVEVNALNAGLLLRGHRLAVNTALDVYQGTITLADGDTLEASGVVNWQGGDESGRLAGGVVLFHGTNFYGYQYRASGTNRLVFDRSAAGQQQIGGFDYNNPSRAGLQHWDIRNRDGVRLCGHVAVDDTLTFTSTGSYAVLDNGSCGGYWLRASGPFVTSANTMVSPYDVDLHHATGTSLVAGGWSPGSTDVYAAGAVLKPGLTYQTLRLYTSVTFSGAMSLTGSLEVDGSATELVLGGQHVSVGGTMDVTNGAVLTMANPADSLLVAGTVNFYGDTRVVELTRITAGLLQVGGLFNGSGFNAAGTNLVRLTGSAGGSLYIYGLNYQSYDQGFQNLEIAAGATIGNCNHSRVRGTMTLRAGSTLQQQCGGYSIRIDGDLVTEAGSTFAPFNVELRNPTGTQHVAGTFAPTNTSIYTPLAPGQLKAGLGYQNIGIYAAVTLPGNLSVSGDLTVTSPTGSLALGGHRLDVAGRLTVSDNGILSMTSAADSLVANGTTSWYGASSVGKLTAGTLVMRGDSFCATSFYASGTHRTVFDRAGSPVRIDCVGGNPQLTPFNDADIGGYGVLLNCSMYVAGTTHLLAGARVEENCGSGTLYAQGPLVTDAGSSIANGAAYPGSNQLGVALADSSATARVAGAWGPHWTYFTSLHPRINPGLGYRNVRIERSTTLADSLTFNGDLLVINDGTILTLGGHRLDVRGSMELSNTATLRMDSPADTLLLATGDQTAHVYWAGGDNSGALLNGVVKFSGARLYAPAYKAVAPQRFVFTGTASGAPVSVEGAPVFGRMEIAGTRSVNLNDRATVLDTLLISTPTQLLGGTQLVMSAGTGALVTVAGSDVSIPNVYLDNPSGTRAVQGRFRPTNTWLRNASPAADAFKPGLEYASVHLEGPYAVTQSMAVGGDFSTNTAVGELRLNGHRLSVGGNLDILTGSAIRMSVPADSLLVGGHFSQASDAGISTMSAGVVRVSGDYLYLQRAGSGASGTHRFVVDATGGGNMDIYASADGQHNFRDLDIATTRTVRLLSNVQVSGALNVLTPVAVNGNQLVMGGALSTVAGSTLQLAGSLDLSDASGTSQLLGAYRANSVTRFLAATSAIAVRTGTADSLSYRYIEVAGAGTVSGGPLRLTNDLTLTTSGASLTVPTGSTFGGRVETYGVLTFAGGATMVGDLVIHRGGGQAIASTRTDYIDAAYIYNNEAASGQLAASVLDNSPANPQTGTGFRYRAGYQYLGGGTLLGPTPSTHP